MERIERFIERNRDRFHLIGPVGEESIREAEQQLSLSIPRQLRDLWRNYGALSFKHFEIFGVGVPARSHLSAVKRTLQLRNEQGFPNNAVAVEDLGDGHFAICTTNGEVLEWAAPYDGGPLGELGEDLESYLLDRFSR